MFDTIKMQPDLFVAFGNTRDEIGFHFRVGLEFFGALVIGAWLKYFKHA